MNFTVLDKMHFFFIEFEYRGDLREACSSCTSNAIIFPLRREEESVWYLKCVHLRLTITSCSGSEEELG